MYFNVLEWIFTILFTIEYVIRIMVVKQKRSYVFSFFGIVDLLSILPTYLSFIFSGAQVFIVIRIIRLIRIFRILKLAQFIGAGQYPPQCLAGKPLQDQCVYADGDYVGNNQRHSYVFN